MLHKEIEKNLTPLGAKTKFSSGMNTEGKRLSVNNWGNIETATGVRNKNA
jgi:hypothetical protein